MSGECDHCGEHAVDCQCFVSDFEMPKTWAERFKEVLTHENIFRSKMLEQLDEKHAVDKLRS